MSQCTDPYCWKCHPEEAEQHRRRLKAKVNSHIARVDERRTFDELSVKSFLAKCEPLFTFDRVNSSAQCPEWCDRRVRTKGGEPTHIFAGRTTEVTL